MKKRFCCYFYFVGWSNISLGFHISTAMPNIEIHLPFGFVRVGMCEILPRSHFDDSRTFGYEPEYYEH